MKNVEKTVKLLRGGKAGVRKYLQFIGMDYLLMTISRENFIDLVCELTENKNPRDLRMHLNRMFDEYENLKQTNK